MMLPIALILCNLTVQTCEREPIGDFTCQIIKSYAASQGKAMECVPAPIRHHRRKERR